MKLSSRFCKAGIDLGSSKVCCWIGHQPQPEASITILGAGHMATKGIWSGDILDIRALEHVLTSVLYEAEQQAKVQIRSVNVSLNGAFFLSNYGFFQTPITSYGNVSTCDVDKLFNQVARDSFFPIHIIPLAFYVDQQKNICDPIGMMGQELSAKFHTLWIHQNPLQTLRACFKRCQLRISNVILSTYSSAFACLSSDEQELGVTLIDVGASNTNLCFFSQKKMIAFCTIPLGGHHITQDVARGCETSLSHAERLKTLHGAALVTAYDQQEMIPIHAMNDDNNPTQVPRSFLISIIQARCKEIIQHIKAALHAIPYANTKQRLVLTGGGSQLSGLRELVQRQLDCPVRVAKPLLLVKAPWHSEEFSAITGTFLYKKDPLFSPLASKKHSYALFSWLKRFMI